MKSGNEKLKRALNEIFLENGNAIDDEFKDVKCSKECTDKIEKIFEKHKKHKRFAIRGAIAATLAVVLLLSGCAILGRKIGGFVEQDADTHVKVYPNNDSYNQEENSNSKDAEDGQETAERKPSTLENIYHPTFIPENFKKDKEIKTQTLLKINYISDMGETIIYKQNTYKSNYAFDNDNESKELSHGDLKIYYRELNDSAVYLWQDEGYVFSLYVENPVNTETSLNIISSLKSSPI